MTPSFFLDSALPAEAAYELTPLGRRELDQGSTRASACELEMLVRFDGALSVEQVRAGMRVTGAQFDAAFHALQRAGWIQPRASDRFERELEVQVAQLQRTDEAAADAGEVSLRRHGFFVQIARERAGRERTTAGPLHAVIIEDEPVLARFIKTYLLLDGIESRIAGDRSAVVAILSSPPVPDVILLDVHLPDADGFQILSRLRAHAVLGHVPVVILTADATRQSVIRGIAGGADGYVTKPFDAEAMARAVRTCLGLGDATSASSDPWNNRDAKPLKWQWQGR